MPLKNNLLKIQNLSKTFSNGFQALKNINLEINENELIVIAGKNGSGKTVLMKHLNGLFKPDKGDILYRGNNILKDMKLIRQKIGLIFQDPSSQIIGQTVEEDVSFGPKNLNFSKEKISKNTKSALRHTKLEKLKDHTSYTLSGGEKKRLTIAGVLAMDPEILIFDEPFANLDYPNIKTTIKNILHLKKQKHTIIVITHDIEKILAHATRLIIMDDGKVKEDDTPKKLIGKLEKYGLKVPYGKNRKIETMTWIT